MKYAIDYQRKGIAWTAVPQKHALRDVWLLVDLTGSKQQVVRGCDGMFVTESEARLYAAS